jgi:hypothetical protein
MPGLSYSKIWFFINYFLDPVITGLVAFLCRIWGYVVPALVVRWSFQAPYSSGLSRRTSSSTRPVNLKKLNFTKAKVFDDVFLKKNKHL